MKALGIDYGDARIGIAVSDALGLVARPLETLRRDQQPHPTRYISNLAGTHGVTTVVIGLPLHLDGSAGKAVDKVRKFAAALRAELPPAIAIAFCDERLSTIQAQNHLKRAGVSARAGKSLVDQTAAAVILQDWLDQQSGPALLPPASPEY